MVCVANGNARNFGDNHRKFPATGRRVRIWKYSMHSRAIYEGILQFLTIKKFDLILQGYNCNLFESLLQTVKVSFSYFMVLRHFDG